MCLKTVTPPENTALPWELAHKGSTVFSGGADQTRSVSVRPQCGEQSSPHMRVTVVSKSARSAECEAHRTCGVTE